jgi:hypothetical protein
MKPARKSFMSSKLINVEEFFDNKKRSLLSSMGKIIAPYVDEHLDYPKKEDVPDADDIVNNIHEHIDLRDLANNLDLSDIVYHLDSSEIAESISEDVDWDSMIGDAINEDTVADNLDYERLAGCVLDGGMKDELEDSIKKEMAKRFIIFVERIMSKENKDEQQDTRE